VAEMRLRKRNDNAFPNHKVLERLCSKRELLERLVAFCSRTDGWSDVAVICARLAVAAPEPEADGDELEHGYVYLALMKIGRERRYKIGKANIVERRAKQVGVQLPEDLELVHAINTDDAFGIEAYWHRRFDTQRRNGEWFDLSAADVKAFKRRKFM
jgi:hypothetical protein